MNFELPAELQAFIEEVDAFVESTIRPLEAQDDNIRFFDHRREDARTDWDRGGLPNEEWEALLAEVRRRARCSRMIAMPRLLPSRPPYSFGKG